MDLLKNILWSGAGSFVGGSLRYIVSCVLLGMALVAAGYYLAKR